MLFPRGSWFPNRPQLKNALIRARHAPWFQIPTLSQVRRTLPFLLMAGGAALLLYVGLQYWTMYSEQDRLAREWNAQQSETVGLKPPEDRLTRLTIPKINLSVVIVEGTDHKSLLLGPGHIKNTPAPGEPGNSVISAHRDTFFRHIYELNKGDTVVVQRNGRAYNYQVTAKKIVDPEDLSVLRQSRDPQLTLITCYPTYYIGPAPERLVVFTKLAEDDSRAELLPSRPESGKASAPGTSPGKP